MGRARLLAAGLVLGGCSAVAPAPEPAPRAQPPAPPAACLLDGAALTATTGITWTPDQSTATDTRCVYDPAGSSGPAGFLTVEVSPSADDAATQLDTIAALCVSGSRADVDAADGGFTCRYNGSDVYAAMVRADQLVTISSSAVPAGTTAAELALGLADQLTKIGAA
jgi:hypothetical protein